MRDPKRSGQEGGGRRGGGGGGGGGGAHDRVLHVHVVDDIQNHSHELVDSAKLYSSCRHEHVKTTSWHC